MKKTAVIDIVGLSSRLICEHTPFLKRWVSDKNVSHIEPVLPSVTTTVQTTYLTGKWPAEHGIVANGWFFRDTQEVALWKQSNKLVCSPNIWDNARNKKSDFTVANMFWWYNMYTSADYSVTPRPQYRANGLKVPDCYSHPAELRGKLQEKLGIFPLFDFWGPKTSIKSSQWIADASKLVHEWHNPDLLLVYLPHLDYVLQKYGHDEKYLVKDLNEIDEVCKGLISYLEAQDVEVLVLSEYGITEVDRPIHLNRILRKEGLLAIREENGLELLDAGASKAFALADHQIAHIYVNDHEYLEKVKEVLTDIEGVELIIDEETKKKYHLDHERAGELVVMADARSWFTYYYWLDEAKSPDFARTVDIHKKPGFDPVEMFLDKDKPFLYARLALKLLGKKLGFRTLMNVISLDPALVKGSHGRLGSQDIDKAVLISKNRKSENVRPIDIHDIIMETLFS